MRLNDIAFGINSGKLVCLRLKSSFFSLLITAHRTAWLTNSPFALSLFLSLPFPLFACYFPDNKIRTRISVFVTLVRLNSQLNSCVVDCGECIWLNRITMSSEMNSAIKQFCLIEKMKNFSSAHSRRMITQVSGQCYRNAFRNTSHYNMHLQRDFLIDKFEV